MFSPIYMPVIVPSPIIHSAGTACTGDGCNFVGYLVLVGLIGMSYFIPFIMGLSESTMECGPDYCKYFDNLAKRIWFTFALGLVIGRFLFKKRGK